MDVDLLGRVIDTHSAPAGSFILAQVELPGNVIQTRFVLRLQHKKESASALILPGSDSAGFDFVRRQISGLSLHLSDMWLVPNLGAQASYFGRSPPVGSLAVFSDSSWLVGHPIPDGSKDRIGYFNIVDGTFLSANEDDTDDIDKMAFTSWKIVQRKTDDASRLCERMIYQYTPEAKAALG